MKWFKKNDYCIESDCGQFTITKTLGDGTVYFLWDKYALRGEYRQAESSGKFDSADDAKLLAIEKRLENRQRAEFRKKVSK